MRESIVENIDCMIGMARYPDKFFDLAVVDPPYGIGMGGTLNVNSKVKFIDKTWDSKIPKDEYFLELKRVSMNQIVWGANYYPFLWVEGCKGFIHWDKMNHHSNRADGEMAYTSFDRPAMNFRYMWDGNRFGFEGKIDGVGKPTIRIHPTEKPIALYSWIYDNFLPKCNNKHTDEYKYLCTDCNRTFKVLDTHLGSGSNRIAADKAGNIDFTGFEIDKDYYEAQEKRFKDYKKQLNLF